ncbi:MAG: M24 family metallopeptidase [Suilimivivens sp.]
MNVCSTCEEVMCQEELGHGIGLEVEEGIRIWKEVTWKPEAGNVLCIGLKAGIPGKCSVRLQDMVILDKDGVRVIGDTCSAELIEVE